MSIEQRQLERHPERALGVEGAPGVFAYPIAAPGIGRGDVKLRPAPGDFTLQAELRQVVFTQRVRDLGPPDQSLRPPALRAGALEGADRGPVVPAHGRRSECRARHPHGSGQPRHGVCSARPRLLPALSCACQLQLIGQHLRTREIAELHACTIRVDQRLALRDQRLEQRRLVARRDGIEQRLAQRRADLPDRFRQLRLRKCGLQGRLLPRPRTLGGTA